MGTEGGVSFPSGDSKNPGFWSRAPGTLNGLRPCFGDVILEQTPKLEFSTVDITRHKNYIVDHRRDW